MLIHPNSISTRIIPCADLSHHQIGLPVHLAKELFKPWLVAHVVKKYPELASPDKLLEFIYSGIPDQLIDANTLSKVFSSKRILVITNAEMVQIKSFVPVITNQKIPVLHPLSRDLLNVSYDDSVTLICPYAEQAQSEIDKTDQIVLTKPADSELVIPDAYIEVLYEATCEGDSKAKRYRYSKIDEIEADLALGNLQINSVIEYWDSETKKYLRTTVGRVYVFEFTVPFIALSMISCPLTKSQVTMLLKEVCVECGEGALRVVKEQLVKTTDQLLKYMTISFGVSDSVIASNYFTECEKHILEVKENDSQYEQGLQTNGERFNKNIDSLAACIESINNNYQDQLNLTRNLSAKGIVSILNNSETVAVDGALGGAHQLMSKPDGSITEVPTFNYHSGQSVYQLFVSEMRAVKSNGFKKVKSYLGSSIAQAVYKELSRLSLSGSDCGTTRGLPVTIADGEDTNRRTLLGRVTAKPVLEQTGEVIIPINQMIGEFELSLIIKHEIEGVIIRSPLFCESSKGICSQCYGQYDKTGEIPEEDDDIGLITAQGIQDLVMNLYHRRFFIGGWNPRYQESLNTLAARSGVVRFINGAFIENEQGQKFCNSKCCWLLIEDQWGSELQREKITIGAEVLVSQGACVRKSDALFIGGVYDCHIRADKPGKIVLHWRSESDYSVHKDEICDITAVPLTFIPTSSDVRC